MKNNPFPLKKANNPEINFDQQGGAYSCHYQDIYAQVGQAIDEKKHVFLQGNDLPENWRQKDQFTIAEIGFGTGLNFLNTMQLWNESTESKQQLHYISCELFPLNTQQLKQALRPFPSLKNFSETLIEVYPIEQTYGFHRLHFTQYNITLTLIFADCFDALSQLDATVDAWYLDGFNPSKNPQMWRLALCQKIADLSIINATLATFSVARSVRDHLQAVGFVLTKRPGFGKKREMLTAKLTQPTIVTREKPWQPIISSADHQNYTVLGAGISGLSIAQKLQNCGKSVTLIDKNTEACQGASGNRQAMIMPSLMLNDGVETQFYAQAFFYAIRHYDPHHYHACGVHHIAKNDKQRTWQKQLLTAYDVPKSLVQNYQEGLLYPQAGWLDVHGHAQHIMHKLKDHQQFTVTEIHHENNQWHLYSNGKNIHSTDVLILANGIHFLPLLTDYDLPVTPKHGQVSYFDSDKAVAKLSQMPHVLLSKGYITPSHGGKQLIGATFDHTEKAQWFDQPAIKQDHWQRNIQHWHNTIYQSALNELSPSGTDAGLRVTTADHLPICGPLVDQPYFIKHYRDIHHGKRWKQYPQPRTLKNLYLMTGLGARGFTSAPLLAEFLCNQILNQPLVLNKTIQNHIHPNRFLYKKLIKNAL